MALQPLTPERRRQQTREHLLAAAAEVFAERGFHGASLDEVAAVAGFTKGAVYSNFKNKEDLFLALLKESYDREMQAPTDDIGGFAGSTGSPHLGLRGLDQSGDSSGQKHGVAGSGVLALRRSQPGRPKRTDADRRRGGASARRDHRNGEATPGN